MTDLTALSDAWIYHRIAEGGGEAGVWDEFLRRFQLPCYRIVRRTLTRRLGGEAGAELSDEVFQSFFLSLLKDDRRLLRRYRGDGGCSPRTYLCYLAGYHALTELRSRKSLPDLYRVDHESMDDPDRPLRAAHEPSPVDQAASREMLKAALDGLATMSDIDRRIFRLLYVEHLSLAEVAEATGDTLTTVRVQHHRLRKRLKAWLDERGFVTDMGEDEASP